MLRPAFALLVLASCVSSQKPRPRIAAGELLVRGAPGSITAERLIALSGRTDFSVDGMECLQRTCRVLVSRTDGLADEGWTWALVDALTRAESAELSVEANTLQDFR